MRRTVLVAVFLGVVCAAGGVSAQPLPELEPNAKPWTYWWWMGSAVDPPNITASLEALAANGLGGVHIIPIYGVKGEESRFIDYLSPQWMEMLAHTVSEARRLGMDVDMSTGTGWPFGGPNVTEDMSTCELRVEKLPFEEAEPFRSSLPEGTTLAMAYYADGKVAKVTADLKAGSWTPPADGTLYAVGFKPTGGIVERAAPAGAGLVVNAFSPDALNRYLARFNDAFAGYNGPLPRAQYHDSFEYPGDSAPIIFEAFEDHRGYSLLWHLPALMGEGDTDRVARVRHDYRETLDDLLGYYTKSWVFWSHERGFATRNQAHGSPGNLLDLYAMADIPETEIFGPSGFPIPGLRTDPFFEGTRPNPLVIKMASSAAHVNGKRLVSSESCTWLGEHFRVALSQAKPELDQLFTAGVNHVFYHGIAYSPKDAPWPGWLFYASTNFAPSNPQWPHFGALNAYVERVQSALRSGESDNDVLVYFPIHDVWQRAGGPLAERLSVHHTEWLDVTGFNETMRYLWSRGYGFDAISDDQLGLWKVEGGALQTPKAAYRVIVVPRCRYMPVGTLQRLLDLARDGAHVLFPDGMPDDVPGLLDAEKRKTELRKLRETAQGKHLGTEGDLGTLLAKTPALREPMAEQGLTFVRRREADGHSYFIANLGERSVDDWVPMGTKAAAAVLADPLRPSRTGMAAWNEVDGQCRCYLQLEPGESLLLRTYAGQAPAVADWPYLQTRPLDGVSLESSWQVEFLEGGPELPPAREVTALASWTTWDDKAKDFAGVARYRALFTIPPGAADEWLLDLGDVRESARVLLNGEEIETVFALPFRARLGNRLKPGENELVIEVANLGANRIAAMDRQGIEWRRFYEINFVNIRYQPFDASGWEPVPSGLLGPVRLIPADHLHP